MWKQSSMPQSKFTWYSAHKTLQWIIFQKKDLLSILFTAVTIIDGNVNIICTGPCFRRALLIFKCCWSASTTNFRFKRSATRLVLPVPEDEKLNINYVYRMYNKNPKHYFRDCRGKRRQCFHRKIPSREKFYRIDFCLFVITKILL